MVDGFAKMLLVWMIAVSAFVLRLKPNYRFGPHEDLDIMGITINTHARYAMVAMFCIVNSFIRSVETDIIHAWLINNVQDVHIHKSQEVRKIAYQVAVIHAMYYWWDWFIYMNILLAQFDLFLIEMLASIITTVITTRMYLQDFQVILHT